ncbi:MULTISPECIES: hypothetical protein [unclassified Kribbella]|uniref:hypothetical protein n=1 Tax=unclassified Kribbella TaxID=2644121 RepID=UPI0033DE14CF
MRLRSSDGLLVADEKIHLAADTLPQIRRWILQAGKSCCQVCHGLQLGEVVTAASTVLEMIGGAGIRTVSFERPLREELVIKMRRHPCTSLNRSRSDSKPRRT